MKSPYFQVRLKDCWASTNDAIELPDISNDGFEVVVDWVYTARLPDRVKKYQKGDLQVFACVLDAYKAADILTISQLEDEIIASEAVVFAERGMWWKCSRLADTLEHGLSHTKYYHSVIKNVVANMMNNGSHSTAEWEQDMQGIQDHPQILADLLKAIKIRISAPEMGLS